MAWTILSMGIMLVLLCLADVGTSDGSDDDDSGDDSEDWRFEKTHCESFHPHGTTHQHRIYKHGRK